MKIRSITALVGLTAALQCAAVEPPFYIELDGRWYKTETSTPFLQINSPMILFRGAKMDLCNRTDGQPQVIGGGFFAYVGMFSVPVYNLTSWRIYRPDALPGFTVISMKSLPRNIGCLYEIPSPIPDRLFKNGFERDKLFAGGFDSVPTPPAVVEPLSITLNLTSGGSCVFTTDKNGLRYEEPGSIARATGDFACGPAGGDPYGTAWVLAGPSTWNIAIPWRPSQTRTASWYAYPAETCTVTSTPISGQPANSMTLTGDTTCNGVGTSSGQPNPGVCWSIGNHQVTMTPSVAGAYLLALTCRRGSLERIDQRTLVVSPPL